MEQPSSGSLDFALASLDEMEVDRQQQERDAAEQIAADERRRHMAQLELQQVREEAARLNIEEERLAAEKAAREAEEQARFQAELQALHRKRSAEALAEVRQAAEEAERELEDLAAQPRRVPTWVWVGIAVLVVSGVGLVYGLHVAGERRAATEQARLHAQEARVQAVLDARAEEARRIAETERRGADVAAAARVRAEAEVESIEAASLVASDRRARRAELRQKRRRFRARAARRGGRRSRSSGIGLEI